MTGAAATLLASLLRRIAVEGPLRVDQYMAAALYHPRHGYYMRGDPFGAGGDFTTAPEVSQMFGELIGLWCADLWQRMGRPAPLRLVELGPGRGSLMADALRAVATVPGCREAFDLHLVELSPALQAVQRATLADADVQWHGDLGGVPDGAMLVVANELFDALPVRQLERQVDGWHECLVGAAPDGESLAWTRTPGPVAAAGLLPSTLADAAPGTLAEICPAGLSLAATLAEHVAAAGGAALLVDFGRAASGPGATLQAVRRHRAQDPLAAPGTADLAAHVDFAALAAAARAAGARVHGPVPQGAFLQRLGIAGRAAALARKATPAQRRDIEAALHRLIAPGEMGTLFQVLALCHPQAPVPAGFAD